MGAELAVTDSQPATGLGFVHLAGFADEVVAKIHLEDEGEWVLMGRVAIANFDGDQQHVTGKLVHDANVVIDEVNLYIPGDQENVCIYLQAGFLARGKETITVECNTYKGQAYCGSIIALKVDEIDRQ